MTIERLKEVGRLERDLNTPPYLDEYSLTYLTLVQPGIRSVLLHGVIKELKEATRAYFPRASFIENLPADENLECDLAIVQVDQRELPALPAILNRASSALRAGGQLLIGVRNAIPKGAEWPLAFAQRVASKQGFHLEDIGFIRDPNRVQYFVPPGEDRIRVELETGVRVEVDTTQAWQLAAAEVVVKAVKAPAEETRFDLELSIVIPVFNKLEYTRPCLESLLRTIPASTRYEIIVVDNGSTDGTREYLKSLPPPVRAIINKENLGFARACNQGAELARGEYLFFLNNDTVAQPGWLAPLLETAKSDRRIGVVGCKLLFPHGTIQHAGVAIASAPGHKVVPIHVFAHEPSNTPATEKRQEFQVLTGAALLIRKALFEDLGGFDEVYWNGNEDVDLCFKAVTRGFRNVYEPRSVFIHYESVSGPERFRKVAHNVRVLEERWSSTIGNDVGYVYARNGLKAEPDPRQFRISSRPLGMTSIIVLTHNQLPYTKLCVESILEHTDVPYELILVDNASTDGTREYVRGLSERHRHVRAILNERNYGFPGGNNVGLAAAKGDYLLVLNNDTVVTPGYLSRMLGHLHSIPGAGIVGPCTNSISGPQRVPFASYRDLSDLNRFAAMYSQIHQGEAVPAPRLVGFCLLFSREVLDRIGGFDPAFGIGNFEDDDFCLRAHMAGFLGILARDVFIHHFGSATFRAAHRGISDALAYAWEVFKAKWKLPPDLPLEQAGYVPAELYRHPQNQRNQYVPPVPEINANLLSEWSVALYQKGQLQQAAITLDIALRSDPDHIDSHFNMGMILLAQNQPMRALEHILRALRQSKGDPELWSCLGACLVELREFTLARKVFLKAASLAPANEAIQLRLQADSLPSADHSPGRPKYHEEIEALLGPS